jgi:hypothetical protein
MFIEKYQSTFELTSILSPHDCVKLNAHMGILQGKASTYKKVIVTRMPCMQADNSTKKQCFIKPLFKVQFIGTDALQSRDSDFMAGGRASQLQLFGTNFVF